MLQIYGSIMNSLLLSDLEVNYNADIISCFERPIAVLLNSLGVICGIIE